MAIALFLLPWSDGTRCDSRRGIALVPCWLWLWRDPGALAASLGRNLALSGGVLHKPWENEIGNDYCNTAGSCGSFQASQTTTSPSAKTEVIGLGLFRALAFHSPLWFLFSVLLFIILIVHFPILTLIFIFLIIFRIEEKGWPIVLISDI